MWKLTETGFDSERIASDGNRFLVGNGYMGVRGTLEEYGKEQLAAVNLAGIYDLAGNRWREPVNAPNPLFAFLCVDKTPYLLPEMAQKCVSHTMELDFRSGLFRRKTVWNCGGKHIEVRAERFADAQDHHRLCMSYTVCSDQDAQITLTTGIDADVWDINGPHYDERIMSQENGRICVAAVTHENRDCVWVTESCAADFAFDEKTVQGKQSILRIMRFAAKAGKTYTIKKAATVYTSRDPDAEDRKNLPDGAGYDNFRIAHQKIWEERWKNSEITIEGDDMAMRALNYSLYHLHSIAPRHVSGLSIPARGLSGQTYKGAVFWDTEIFMLDFFLYTEPEVAKTLLKYRIETLAGARKKAQRYGYDGAFYAWESQEGGFDACSDYNVTDVFTGRPMRTYFKDKQVHISAAVVYGFAKYLNSTGDLSILEEGGLETILECARFYESLLLRKMNGKQYEIHDVVGPDEYHERVNNNGYTNRMAQFTLRTASELLGNKALISPKLWEKLNRKYDLEKLALQFADTADQIFIPRPDQDTGVVQQFDGYLQLEDVSVDEVRRRLIDPREYWGGAYGVAAQTQVIKQADIVAWMAMFPDDFPLWIQRANWEYYGRRTEHGSSLSACMYALLACRIGESRDAYSFFMKSALEDMKGKGKEWAGLVYIGGTHPAASGGAYINAVEGFGGLRISEGKPDLHPRLPDGWKSLRFRVHIRGKLYEIFETGQSVQMTEVREENKKCRISEK